MPDGHLERQRGGRAQPQRAVRRHRDRSRGCVRHGPEALPAAGLRARAEDPVAVGDDDRPGLVEAERVDGPRSRRIAPPVAAALRERLDPLGRARPDLAFAIHDHPGDLGAGRGLREGLPRPALRARPDATRARHIDRPVRPDRDCHHRVVDGAALGPGTSRHGGVLAPVDVAAGAARDHALAGGSHCDDPLSLEARELPRSGGLLADVHVHARARAGDRSAAGEHERGRGIGSLLGRRPSGRGGLCFARAQWDRENPLGGREPGGAGRVDRDSRDVELHRADPRRLAAGDTRRASERRDGEPDRRSRDRCQTAAFDGRAQLALELDPPPLENRHVHGRRSEPRERRGPRPDRRRTARERVRRGERLGELEPRHLRLAAEARDPVLRNGAHVGRVCDELLADALLHHRREPGRHLLDGRRELDRVADHGEAGPVVRDRLELTADRGHDGRRRARPRRGWRRGHPLHLRDGGRQPHLPATARWAHEPVAVVAAAQREARIRVHQRPVGREPDAVIGERRNDVVANGRLVDRVGRDRVRRVERERKRRAGADPAARRVVAVDASRRPGEQRGDAAGQRRDRLWPLAADRLDGAGRPTRRVELRHPAARAGIDRAVRDSERERRRTRRVEVQTRPGFGLHRCARSRGRPDARLRPREQLPGAGDAHEVQHPAGERARRPPGERERRFWFLRDFGRGWRGQRGQRRGAQVEQAVDEQTRIRPGEEDRGVRPRHLEHAADRHRRELGRHHLLVDDHGRRGGDLRPRQAAVDRLVDRPGSRPGEHPLSAAADEVDEAARARDGGLLEGAAALRAVDLRRGRGDHDASERGDGGERGRGRNAVAADGPRAAAVGALRDAAAHREGAAVGRRRGELHRGRDRAPRRAPSRRRARTSSRSRRRSER